MADLDVQPKKKNSWLPWLIAAIILLLLLFFLLRGCNKNTPVSNPADTTSAATNNTSGAVGTTTPAGDNSTQGADWNIDRNAPVASYQEITDSNISVRGNDNYGIYSLGENILFNTDKATLRTDAEQNLKQLATSIEKRFTGGQVRIYGYTDSVGSKGYNKELAQQRAEAVRNWLVATGNIDSSRISLNAIGEGQPIASNTTAQGRQQNRRVEIVARKAQ